MWRRRDVQVVSRIVLVAVVVALVVWRVDWRSMKEALHPQHPWVLVGAIAANFASVIFKGFAWKGVVDELPEVDHRLRLRQVVSPLFVGFLFNTVLAARIGEIVKVMLLRRRMHAAGIYASGTTLIGTVVAENLVSTITWVLFVIAIGIVLPLPTYAWLLSLTLGALCLAVVVAALVSRYRHHQPDPGAGTTLVDRILVRVKRLWAAVERSHDALRSPRALSIIGGASLLTWFAQLGGIYMTLYAFGLKHVGWGGAGLLLVTVTLAQAFPVLPGNLVLFQAAALVPLTASYGVSASTAIAFSLVLQFTEAVVGVAFGFIFLMSEGVAFGELRRSARSGGLNEDPPPGPAEA